MGEQSLATNKYVPGSSEKKRAVMMYLLLGIILLSTSKLEPSSFEIAHFKQALGWRSVFLLILLVNIVLLFIPFLRWIGVIVLLIGIVIAGIFVKQARDGEYYVLKQESPLFLFQGIGEWIVNIFDIRIIVHRTEHTIVEDICLDDTPQQRGEVEYKDEKDKKDKSDERETENENMMKERR